MLSSLPLILNNSDNDKGMYLANLIKNNVPRLFQNIHIIDKSGELQILVCKENLIPLLTFLKMHTLLQFKSLQDIWAVDYIDYNVSIFELDKKNRFQVLYYLLSVVNQTRILIKVNLSTNQSLDSTANLYGSASWLEREIWDMFGLFFKNHPDLRRILTDYGFEGHPLRKDFPLAGYTEILYTTELKKISVKPLELTQEYRVFDFVSPWDVRK